MSRSIITRPGKEHPNSCEGWKKLVEDGRISYKWAACDCSMMERSYQILKDDVWKDISYCPFCSEKINYWQSIFQPLSEHSLEITELGLKVLAQSKLDITSDSELGESRKIKCPYCHKEWEE